MKDKSDIFLHATSQTIWQGIEIRKNPPEKLYFFSAGFICSIKFRQALIELRPSFLLFLCF